MEVLMQRNIITYATFAVVALGLGAGTAPAQQHDHIDRLARRIEKQAKVIHDEVDQHFPRARALHRHAKDLERLGEHLHDLAHEKGQRAHMRADARKMDRLIHDMEDHVKALRDSGLASRRALRHIREAMEDLHDTLNHLRKHLEF
jgi:chromosome segregation ATPase